MTTEYQTAINLMDSVIAKFKETTNDVERGASFDLLLSYLLDTFPSPLTHGAKKDTPEYEQWLTELNDVTKVLWTQGMDLDSLLRTTPEELLPTSVAPAVLKALIHGHHVMVMSMTNLTRFNEFYEKYRLVILSATNPNLKI